MASDRSGQRVVLRAHPEGAIKPSDFSVEAQSAPEVKDGEFLVRSLFISVDPMLRLFVDKAPLGGTMPGLPAGATIPGAAVAEVIESRHPGFAIGDIVEGRFGWQDYATSNGQGIRKVNPKLGPPETALGIAGLPGFTAYVGVAAAGGVKPGQTVLVSGAAGAVGSMVAPFVRARGGRVVGIAGGEAKRAYLAEVGYDAVADRLSPDFEQQLKEALPNGADLYFDNVGGPLLAQMMPFMARGALVLISGLMAQYQGDADTGGDDLPAVLRAVMGKGVRIQSFTQFGQDAQRPAFEVELTGLIADGKIASAIHVEEGIERLPHALAGLFENSQTGKVVVKVADPETVAREPVQA